MEESTKKIFKPKFELVQECNGLVSIHLGKHAAAAILQGTEITGTTQEDHQCCCVVQFLETLPLTHWELGLKNCARTKGIFYIIYQIAYVVNIQTLFGEVCLSQGKRAASFCLINSSYYI
jgi:hypothetical protein